METIYKGKDYSIVKIIKDDPIEWQTEAIANLCKELIAEESEVIKKQFFTKSLPDKFQNIDPDNSSLPVLFFDPNCSIAAGKFNPCSFSKSRVVLCIKHYAKDTRGNYQEFAKRLANKGVLLEDEFKIIKCTSCKSVTLGSGIKCSLCGEDCSKTYPLYRFSEDLTPILFSPGKIIEGIVLHSLKDQLEDKDYTVYPNLYLRKKDGQLFKFDLDTVVIDNKKERPLVILSSIKPGARNELHQVNTLKENGIPTLFVTTANCHNQPSGF